MKPSAKNWRERFRRVVDCAVRLDEPLAGHTTFAVGGPAALLAWVEDEAQLKEARRFLQAEGVPWRILGGGSNVLVADDGWPGAVLKLRGRLAEVRLLHEGSRVLEVEVGAGCTLARLLGWATARGGGALGALWGIPASLGGALKYNAGTRLGSVGELVVEAALLEENGVRRYRKESLRFGYRYSAVGRRRMVLNAVLRLPRWPREKIDRLMIEARALRAGQPRGARSAGCFFRNPTGHSAGQLIDRAGCKGWREGGAEVSEAHANFIVNRGGASAADILRLARRVAAEVYRKFGIRLRPEVELWGNFSGDRRP